MRLEDKELLMGVIVQNAGKQMISFDFYEWALRSL